MKLVFSDEAWEDYLYWAENNPKVRDRINELIKQCKRTPFKGVGKPEPLRGDLSGWWSRVEPFRPPGKPFLCARPFRR